MKNSEKIETLVLDIINFLRTKNIPKTYDDNHHQYQPAEKAAEEILVRKLTILLPKTSLYIELRSSTMDNTSEYPFDGPESKPKSRDNFEVEINNTLAIEENNKLILAAERNMGTYD